MSKTRPWALLGLVLLPSLVFSCCAPKSSEAARTNDSTLSWPMYQANTTHNAVARTAEVLPWTYDSGSRINGGLSIAGDKLLLDTFAGDIIALRLTDGKALWISHVDNIVMSTPIVTDGMVIVGSGRNGGPDQPSTTFVYAPSSSANSDDLFWGRDEGDHIFALSLETGKRMWSFKTAGEDMPSGVATDGKFVFANGDGHAYALSLAHGSALWRQNLDGISTMASATATGDSVFVSTCQGSAFVGDTIALRVSNGAEIWRAPYGNCDSSPTYANGRLFLSGVDGNRISAGFGGSAVIVAVDASTGHKVWLYRSKAKGLYTEVSSSERAISGTYAEHLYLQPVPTEDKVLALEERTGRVRWAFKSMAPVKMSPIVYRNRVYFGDSAGLLYCVDLRNGNLIRAKAFNQPFSTSPPVVAGDEIIVVNGDQVTATPLLVR